ncbi:facilitated trehalose transporter Tret1-like [Galleria mellonella]|uniref:Facilitated trehalose transporter Tret1-like n=1 Tax=Galleria mellonella TaxID=7137 RepID=A0ABM3MAJ9_GALME|nr:facilitated trehalose transporter Tret1-like [Galleria mellonella]
MGVIVQVIATFILSYSSLVMGLTFAWPSSTFLIFTSENTTLNRPMTDGETALLGSLSSIGALVGNPIASVLLNTIGRKYCGILTASIGVISWLMISFSNQVEVILAALFIYGISSSVFLVIPVFITEFCQESIRGTMAACSVTFFGLGMLVSNLLGGCLEYHTLTYVSLSMSVFGVAMFLFLKESPVYLMTKGRKQEAIKSIAFYRNEKPNSKEVLQELEKIRRILNPDIEGTLKPEKQKLNSNLESTTQEKIGFFKFLKKSRSTRRAMYTILTVLTAAILQGLNVVLVYAKPLFHDVVSEEVISSTLCSILLAATTVVSGIIAGYLTDLVGRRNLLIYASFGAGICCAVIGFQIHLNWGPKWLIAILIYLYSAAYTLGAGTIPFVLLSEVFLPEVKSYMSMLALEWTWLCNFLVLYVFNSLTSAMGLGGIFFIFSVACFLTAVYSIYFVPETKGLTVDVIQLQFLKSGIRRSDIEI